MPERTSETLVSLLSHSRRRALTASLVAIAGFLQIVGALSPRFRSSSRTRELLPLMIRAGTRPLLLFVGLALLLLARALLRGSGAALLLALALATLSSLLNVARDLDPVSTMFTAALAGWLAASGDSFRLQVKVSRLTWLLPASGIGLLGYGLAGWAEFDAGLPNLGTADRITAILKESFVFGDSIITTTRQAKAFTDSLGVAGAAIVIIALATLASPAITALAARTRNDVERFALANGKTSLAPLITVPGNHVLDLLDGHALIGLKVIRGIAVTVGGPVSEAGSERAALEDFLTQCERRGWTPALIGVYRDTAQMAEGLGLQATKIGEEGFLDVASFSLGGSRMANVRHSASRATRAGIEIREYTPSQRSDAMDARLHEISDAWLAGKHGPEMGFTLGRFDPDRLASVETFVALAGAKAVAFVTWLPYDQGTKAVLDLMRRAPGAPPGVMELLITESLAVFAQGDG